MIPLKHCDTFTFKQKTGGMLTFKTTRQLDHEKI